jgi:hypothetical protein
MKRKIASFLFHFFPSCLYCFKICFLISSFFVSADSLYLQHASFHAYHIPYHSFWLLCSFIWSIVCFFYLFRFSYCLSLSISFLSHFFCVLAIPVLSCNSQIHYSYHIVYPLLLLHIFLSSFVNSSFVSFSFSQLHFWSWNCIVCMWTLECILLTAFFKTTQEVKWKEEVKIITDPKNLLYLISSTDLSVWTEVG